MLNLTLHEFFLFDVNLLIPLFTLRAVTPLCQTILDSAQSIEYRSDRNLDRWVILVPLSIAAHVGVGLASLQSIGSANPNAMGLRIELYIGLALLLLSLFFVLATRWSFAQSLARSRSERPTLLGVAPGESPKLTNLRWGMLGFFAFLTAAGLPESNPNLIGVAELLIVFAIATITLPICKPKLEFTPEQLSRLAQRLHEACARCAAAAPSPAPKAIVLDRGRGARYAARASKKWIGVGSLLVRDFDSPLVDFVIAFEYAHLKLKRTPSLRLFNFFEDVLWWCVALGVLVARALERSSALFLVTTFASVAAAFALSRLARIAIGPQSKRRTFEADAYSVAFTRDKESAIRSLTAMYALTYSEWTPEKESWSHPSLERRIEAVRAIELKEIDPPPVMAPA